MSRTAAPVSPRGGRPVHGASPTACCAGVLALLLPVPRSLGAPQEPVRIELHASPLVDLHFHARAAAPEEDPPGLDLAEVRAAVAAIDEALGRSPLSWGLFEGALADCHDAAGLARAFEDLPATRRILDREVPLRALGADLARALAVAEPSAALLAAAHAETLERAREAWVERIAPRERELLEFHLTSLALADPMRPLPVHLVARAPRPGAVTHLSAPGSGVSFVAVEGLPESRLFEVVLHEATHSLDVAAGAGSVLAELRVSLRRAGVPERAAANLVHLLFFVQAAESIRRFVDPEHRDYGDTEGVYSRLGPGAAAARDAWRRHLAGELSRADALAAFVAAAAPPPATPAAERPPDAGGDGGEGGGGGDEGDCGPRAGQSSSRSACTDPATGGAKASPPEPPLP